MAVSTQKVRYDYPMMYSIVLVLHLLTSTVTGLVIVYSLYALWSRADALYRLCALLLGAIAAFEVLSGTALAVLSPTLSASALSIHIFEYLSVCLVAEWLLFARMRKVSLVFPLAAAASPVVASVALFVVAISFGF